MEAGGVTLSPKRTAVSVATASFAFVLA